MTATDAQVRILMRERKKGRTQEQAAAKANLRSRKTVAKYEELGLLPSLLKRPRAYQTRPDAFAEDWPQIEQMLSEAPQLEAKALFEWLQEQKPDKYQSSQLRTFQRRVARWRALNQPQIAMLEQVHEPGEIMELDGTWLTELEVIIQGQPFKHMLVHCVLPYSNWEWGRVVQSESLGAVRLGLQSTLLKLGYVPRIVQTENSSRRTWVLVLIAALMVAWLAWFFLASLPLFEITNTAELASETRVVAYFPPAARIKVRPGQSAQLRLNDFTPTEYDSLVATVISVDDQVRDGRIQVVLHIPSSSAPAKLLQRGLTGTIEIEVERVSPAFLILRAAGAILAGDSDNTTSSNEARP